VIRKSTSYIRSITQIALIVAIMCVLAQLSFYIGPIPITFQTLIVAFCGYFLGVKKGMIAVISYLLLGAVGAPVFAAFGGGFHILISYTGGFLWGFIPYVILCGISKKRIGIAFGLIGMLCCHLCGVIQYSVISKTNFLVAFTVASLPFLLKDIIFTVIAYFAAMRLRKIIKL